MDPSLKKRIDQAWSESKDWITEFDGSPTITLLVNVPVNSFPAALRALSQGAENFRVTAIPAGQPDAPQFIELDSVPEQVALLQGNKLAELSVNYEARFEAFDLDIHMVVHPVSQENVALELVWWSDQVFSEETDDYAQFAALMGYFIDLQKLFSSPNLFISPESGADPSQGTETWVEV